MTYRNRMFFYAGITALIGSVALCALWPRSADAFLFTAGQEIQQTLNDLRREQRRSQPNTSYQPRYNHSGFSQGGGSTPRPPAPSTSFGGSSGGSWGGFSQ